MERLAFFLLHNICSALFIINMFSYFSDFYQWCSLTPWHMTSSDVNAQIYIRMSGEYSSSILACPSHIPTPRKRRKEGKWEASLSKFKSQGKLLVSCPMGICTWEFSLQGFLPESSLQHVFHIVTESISDPNNDIFVTVNKKHNQVVIHLITN